ncbi:MAG: hypothetical protein M3R01_13475 [Actinomycetota bacterium]|nr:hypothetical protein [Actinomycetota bacterium]
MPVAFDEVVEKITDAARHVEADGGASPVLVAVVREFQAKLAKAEKQATDSDTRSRLRDGAGAGRR